MKTVKKVMQFFGGPPQEKLAPSGGREDTAAPNVGAQFFDGSMPNVGVHLVVMGVAGCGKSEIGQRLAAQLGLPLIEGDDFHPASNVQKMQQGVALTDADRMGWLQTLSSELVRHPTGAVLTCSALKLAYRDALRAGTPGLRFVHLAITPQESMRRVAARPGHFYPPALVASQFEALQDPASEPRVLVLDGSQSQEALVKSATDWVGSAALPTLATPLAPLTPSSPFTHA